MPGDFIPKAKSISSSSIMGPFWRRLPEIFKYPFQGNGLFTIIGISIAIYFLNLVWIFHFFALGITFSFLFNIIKQAGMGKKEIPELTDFLDFFDNILLPLIRGLLAIFTIFAPLIFYLLYLKDWSFLQELNEQNIGILFSNTIRDPFILIFFLIGYFYFPIALILAAVNENIFHVINPIIGLNLIRKSFKDYLALLFLIFVFSALNFVLSIVMTQTLLKIQIPFATRFLETLISLYFPILTAYLMGLWIYQNNEVLGYSVRPESAVPLSKINDGESLVGRTSQMDVLFDELNYAKNLMEQGNLTKAQINLVDLHKRFPEDIRPTQELFHIACEKKDSMEISHFGGILLSELLNKGNLDEAEKIYNNLSTYGPKIELPLHLLDAMAKAFYRNKYQEGALKAYMHMGYLYPNDQRSVKALYSAGNMYLDAYQNPQKAVQLFRNLYEIYNQSPLGQNIKDALTKAERLLKLENK